MARISQRDFSSGLVTLPPRELGQGVGLREATGIRNPALGKAIRSRWGSEILVDLTGVTPTGVRLHSLIRHNGNRYQGIGRELRSGAILVTGLVHDTKLAFVQGIPVAGKSERHYLFVAGDMKGRMALFKLLTPSGVVDWGIKPPGTDFTAQEIPYTNGVNVKVFEIFNAATFLIPSGDSAGDSSMQLATSPDQPPLGSLSGNSMVAAVNHRSRTGTFFRNESHNFAFFDYTNSVIASSDQDWIEMDVKIDAPGNLDKMTIEFGVLDDTHSYSAADLSDPAVLFADSYTFDVRVDDSTIRAQPLSPSGVGDIGSIRGDQGAAVQPTDGSSGTPPPSHHFTKTAVESIAVTTLPPQRNVWTRLRIPKGSFARTSFENHNGWNEIIAFGVTIKTNEGPDQVPAQVAFGTLNVGELYRGVQAWFANGVLVGGTGMQGRYSYRCTFLNTRTGHRSNPNPNPVYATKPNTDPALIVDVARRGVMLSGLPISPDPQCNKKELWRTVGNGSIWYRLTPPEGINNLQDTYEDHVADFHGLHDLDTPRRPFILANEELPFDNVQPEDQWTFAYGPHNGQCFWTKDTAEGHEGRWYFSAVGRLEAVAGFLDITTATDKMQGGAILNEQVFACSMAHWFAMQGEGTNWVAREVFGVPGTRYPYAIVATPHGIAYLAEDGVRLFDGTQSVVVGADSVANLFRGDILDAETTPFPLGAFKGDPERLSAAYAYDEYFLTDTDTTYAVNLRTGAWRKVGPGWESAYYEPETGRLTVGYARTEYGWETPGFTTDGGNPIPFLIATPSFVPNAGIVETLVQRLYVDCNTRGETLRAIVWATDDVQATQGGPFPVITNGRQTVEIALGCPAGAAYVTLQGSLGNLVDVYGVELDCHIAEERGYGT